MKRSHRSQYLDILSTYKSSGNLERPFLHLARQLSGDNNLHFVETPVSLDLALDHSLSMKGAIATFFRLHREHGVLPSLYNFIRSNVPRWSSLLKNLDYFFKLGQMGLKYPKAWKLLVDNVFCSVVAPPDPSVPSLVVLAAEALAKKLSLKHAKETNQAWNLLVDNLAPPSGSVPSLGVLSAKAFAKELALEINQTIVKLHRQDEDLLVSCLQAKQVWSSSLKDAESFLHLGEIGKDNPELWGLIVDNLFCPRLTPP
ncbi:MAG: hypothetical protein SGILL_008076 [Bacillariaceae sp.]